MAYKITTTVRGRRMVGDVKFAKKARAQKYIKKLRSEQAKGKYLKFKNPRIRKL